MRRVMFLLSLIAALAATPLRLAEAAHDYADAVAESGVGGDLDAPDGGVGDDSGATIKAEKTPSPSPTAVDLRRELPSHPLLLPTRRSSGRQADPAPPAAVERCRRLSMLQRYLN